MFCCRLVLGLLLLVASQHASIRPANAQQNGAVRLVNGDTPACGRVEVFYGGEWGTVCDDRWGMPSGDVVCQQLGFERAQDVFHTAHFGRGSGPIWMDGVSCGPEDNSILECSHGGWGVHDCSHSEDAGVCCERKKLDAPEVLPVRLSCPECNDGGFCKACPDKRHPDPTDCLTQVAVRGIVEVEVDGVWGPISAETWGVYEAKVACGQLGYPLAYKIPDLEEIWPNYNVSEEGNAGTQCSEESISQSEIFRARLASTLFRGVDCSGKESNLLQCVFTGIGPEPNPSLRVATVQCGFYPHHNCFRHFPLFEVL